MSDKNTKINDMTDEEVIEGLSSEFDRIYNHLLENADELHKSMQMTEAELWESLIPPFQD